MVAGALSRVVFLQRLAREALLKASMGMVLDIVDMENTMGDGFQLEVK